MSRRDATIRVILRKLDEISERQWLDVLGVLRVQGDALDRDYLSRWAEDLGLSDLLERALKETTG
jgi:hypothetical protein